MRTLWLFAGLVLPAIVGLTPAWAQYRTLPTTPAMTSDDMAMSGTGYVSLTRVPLRLNGFNADLASHDYTTFDDRPVAVGGGFNFTVQHLLLGVEGNWQLPRHGTAQVNGQSLHTSFSGAYGFGNIGAVLTQCNTCKIYPFVGVGAGALQLTTRQSAGGSFDDVLGTPLQASHLSRTMLLTQAGLGVDFMLPAIFTPSGDAAGIVVGVRAGYIYTPEPLTRRWRLDGSNLTGGPDPTFDGPYVQVTFGGGWSHVPVQ